MLSEISQKKTNAIWYHLYVESKKKVQISVYTKQKQTQRCRKQTSGEHGGEGEGRDKLGVLG